MNIYKNNCDANQIDINRNIYTLFNYTLFGDIITELDNKNTDMEVNSTYTVTECIDEPLADDSVDTKGSLSSIPLEKDVELIELEKTTKNIFAFKTAKQVITQGNKKYYKVSVGHRVTLLDIDLNWGNKNSRLSVTVYTPTGSSSGTYYDTSDGLRNGRIVLRIKPKSGKKYLQEGSWKFKVYGESIRGNEDYTFKADAHL